MNHTHTDSVTLRPNENGLADGERSQEHISEWRWWRWWWWWKIGAIGILRLQLYISPIWRVEYRPLAFQSGCGEGGMIWRARGYQLPASRPAITSRHLSFCVTWWGLSNAYQCMSLRCQCINGNTQMCMCISQQPHQPSPTCSSSLNPTLPHITGSITFSIFIHRQLVTPSMILHHTKLLVWWCHRYHHPL